MWNCTEAVAVRSGVGKRKSVNLSITGDVVKRSYMGVLNGVFQRVKLGSRAMSSIGTFQTWHFCFAPVFCVKRGSKKKKKKGAKPTNIFFLFFFSSFTFLLHSRVVEKLPGPNRLLLQHLLCVLQHILQSADTNKMDAYNLAVCIGPTLLQLEGTPLDEQKSQMNKVGI